MKVLIKVQNPLNVILSFEFFTIAQLENLKLVANTAFGYSMSVQALWYDAAAKHYLTL